MGDVLTPVGPQCCALQVLGGMNLLGCGGGCLLQVMEGRERWYCGRASGNAPWEVLQQLHPALGFGCPLGGKKEEEEALLLLHALLWLPDGQCEQRESWGQGGAEAGSAVQTPRHLCQTWASASEITLLSLS